MKKSFYFGILCLPLFEMANVYFIMPMPGSQELDSLDLAYFLYSWRWGFRILFGAMIVLGVKSAFSASKWLPAVALLIAAGIAYEANFEMAAEVMFYQPTVLELKEAYIPPDDEVVKSRDIASPTLPCMLLLIPED